MFPKMAIRSIAFCWLLVVLGVASERQLRMSTPPIAVPELKMRGSGIEDCSSPPRSVTAKPESRSPIGQPWAAGVDSSHVQVPISPVSDFESEPMKIDSPFMLDAVAMLEDWQLPPAASPGHFDASWPPSSSYMEGATSPASSQDEFSSSSEAPPGRRRCQVCTLVDATRGVADSGEGGEWELLLCRHCAQFMNNTVTLSTRCEQCRRYATFGPYGGNRRSARHCKRHQLPGEVNVARKRCEFVHRNGVACAQPPLYGDERSGNARFCGWHRQQHHTNLVEGRVAAQMGRRCAEPGCEQAASFGDSGTGAVVCSAHRLPQYVDLIHSRRCEAPQCQRHPSYGTRTGGVARFCKAHKPWNFIDLKTKKCQHPFGCTKRPSFGDAADGIARFCMQHKARQHINVKSRKCQEQGCAKQPTFGDRTDSVVRFCAVHRRDTDVDLVHGRCRSSSCNKIASFGNAGEPPQFCFTHKDERMDRAQLIGRSRRQPAGGGGLAAQAVPPSLGAAPTESPQAEEFAVQATPGGGSGGQAALSAEVQMAPQAAHGLASAPRGLASAPRGLPAPSFSLAAGLDRPMAGMDGELSGRNSVHNLC